MTQNPEFDLLMDGTESESTESKIKVVTEDELAAMEAECKLVIDEIAADNAMLETKEATPVGHAAQAIFSNMPMRVKTELDYLLGDLRRLYSDDIAQAVHAGLGVLGAMSLAGSDNCLVLIYEGPSGFGKSTVVRMLTPAANTAHATNAVVDSHIVRIDKFTPASFVSNSSNRTAEQLSEIDLLPKLKHKTMVTKELAALFGDNEDGLRNTFGILTSVLDGNGYVTGSGAHGTRGYEGDFRFNWLGATTPIKQRVFDLMSQCGNRLLLWEMQARDVPTAELVADEDNDASVGKALGWATSQLVSAHYRRFPANSVDPASVLIPKRLKEQIARYAKLLVAGRVSITKVAKPWEAEEFEVGDKEGPYRPFHLLKMLAKGLALVGERNYVNEDDVRIVRNVAISTLPPTARKFLRLAAGGGVDAAQFAALEKCSLPTARTRMRMLDKTSLFEVTKGTNNAATTLRLRPDWEATMFPEGADRPELEDYQEPRQFDGLASLKGRPLAS